MVHVREYQQWEGNNFFPCGGRVLMGANPCFFLLTSFLIISAFILYVYFISGNYSPAYPFIVSMLYIFQLYGLVNSAFRDPGIIPRNPMPSIEYIDYTGALKYCTTCNIYRPRRCKHCKFCNNCVIEFDHHCPWIGNCIARRNYRYFLIFLINLILLLGFLCSISAYDSGKAAYDFYVQVKHQQGHKWHAMIAKAIINKLPSIFLSISCFCIFVSLFFLGTYHFNLIRIGETTNEHVRKTYVDQNNPYNEGFLRNFYRIFFEPIPPSNLNLRKIVSSRDYSINKRHNVELSLTSHTGLESSQRSSFRHQLSRISRSSITQRSLCGQDTGEAFLPETKRNDGGISLWPR